VDNVLASSCFSDILSKTNSLIIAIITTVLNHLYAKANTSTKNTAASQGSRIPRANEVCNWKVGSKASPGQGPKASRSLNLCFHLSIVSDMKKISKRSLLIARACLVSTQVYDTNPTRRINPALLLSVVPR
jgi:hypothetical protein